ncbi:MAG: ADP-ribosylglycohydrolase family protein [Bacteroidales bacterium]|nr:ADP-ribosylglycohydrolase family protein [Bacteroidales bacterium]
MKKLSFLSLFVVLSVLLSCTSEKATYRKISVDEYMDKVKAGWIGQMVGVGWGGPTEFKWNGVIIPEKEMPTWEPGMVNQFHQDDIYVEMTFLRTLEKYGWDVSIRQAGIDFANSRYMLWHANKEGRDNLRSGIAAPWSGHPKFNHHADDIDYQIEADYAGLISPGMPNLGIELGETFGRIMNYGDGLYGGNFVAGMYAEAFFENDMGKIVEAGLKCVPAESQYAEAIRDVIEQYHQHPDNWVEAWTFINEKYNNDPGYRKFSCSGMDAFNIDAKINGAYIVMGLLYGEGDIAKTTVISTRCGQDSDCNPANATGILCTTIGFENLPDDYKSALDYETRFSYTDYNVSELINVCAMLVRQAVERGGGKIETGDDGKEYFFIAVEEPVPGDLEQCWEPSETPEDVHLTEEEMARIEIRIITRDAYIHQWNVSGPYAEESKDAGQLFDYIFLPEKDQDKAEWKSVSLEGDKGSWMVDFTQLFEGVNVAAYVRSTVLSPADQDAQLFVGSDDGIKVWLNGELVHQNDVQRGFQEGEDAFGIHLNEGANTLMMKITQGNGGWAAAAVVCDLSGNPLEGLEYKAE